MDCCPNCRTPEGTEHAAGCEQRYTTSDNIYWGVSIPLDEQEDILRSAIDDAITNLIIMLASGKEELYDIAHRRLVEGFYAYGSNVFRKTYDELERDVEEELADAIVYEAVKLHVC